MNPNTQGIVKEKKPPRDDILQENREFYFVKGQYLFHDISELKDFSDESDSLDQVDE